WWDVESREIVFICIGYRNPACGPGFLRCLRVPDVLRGDEAIRALWRTPRKSPCPPKAVSGHHRSRRVRQRRFPDTAEIAMSDKDRFRTPQKSPCPATGFSFSDIGIKWRVRAVSDTSADTLPLLFCPFDSPGGWPDIK